jgi:hypothetical protein
MKAFPIQGLSENGDGVSYRAILEQGMDLRDYFAAKAMQGIVDSSIESGLETTQIADSAYRIADAMMKARKQ